MWAFEASYELVRDFNVTASFSYTQAEVAKSNFAPELGKQLSDVPEEQVSLWGVKTIELGEALSMRLGGGVRYAGETLSISAVRSAIASRVIDAASSARPATASEHEDADPGLDSQLVIWLPGPDSNQRPTD